MKILIVVLVCILFTCSSGAFAKEKDSVLTLPANNIAYAETAGIIFIFGACYFASINYERIIDNWLSVRVGYGYSEILGGYLGGGSYYDAHHGSTAMINIHSKGNKKFNVGVGVSYIYNTDIYNTETKEGFYFSPAFCISYRYQPFGGGKYFSIGGTFAFGAGGFNLSYGHVF